jgi:hypothetical protein
MSLDLIPIDIPAGLNSDDTALASSPAWVDGSNVRFHLGRPQVVGGWESLTLGLLNGACRTVFTWTENNTNILDIAFGCHNALQVWQGGALAEVTPALALPAATLGANPLTTASGSPVVTVAQPGHPHKVGDTVTLSGAAAVNGITPNGTFAVASTPDANSWTFAFSANATGTGAGGGAAVVAANQRAWTGGAVDGAGSAGYGTGSYGAGAYGAPSSTDFFALTWSLAAWGQKLIANPRNQTLHIWSNALGTPAQPILNAPAQVTYMLTTPTRQVFALGCNQEASGVFNPLCIRHSGVGDETQWSTISSSASTSREYVLPGGGRIVAGRMIGRYLVVWTNHSLYLGTYVGQVSQIWRFDKVGDRCGLIGPNAAAVLGSTAYWITPDRQFRSYTIGGAVQTVACPIRKDMDDNLAAAQGDKIVAATVAEHNEVWFFYPDRRDGYENSRYLAVAVEGPDAGAWFRGEMARTAFCDAGPATFPVGVTLAGACYWHEKGNAADGGALSWRLTSADMYLDPNVTMLVRKFMPDLGADQLGAVRLTITTRMAPEDPAPRTFGPYPVPRETREVDVLAEGRLFQLTFSGDSYPAYARLGRLLFDAKRRGRR